MLVHYIKFVSTHPYADLLVVSGWYIIHMFPVIMDYFKPFTDVINKNLPQKRIVYALKYTSEYLHIFVSSTIGRGKGISHRHQQRENRRSTVTHPSKKLNNSPLTNPIQMLIGPFHPKMMN